MNPLEMSGYELAMVNNLISAKLFTEVVKYDQTISVKYKDCSYENGGWKYTDKEIDSSFQRIQHPLQTNKMLYVYPLGSKHELTATIKKHFNDKEYESLEGPPMSRAINDIEGEYDGYRIKARTYAWFVHKSDPEKFEALYNKLKIKEKAAKKDAERQVLLKERQEKKIADNKFTVGVQQNIAREIIEMIFPKSDIVRLLLGMSLKDPTGKILFDALDSVNPPELREIIVKKLTNSQYPDSRRLMLTYAELNTTMGLLDQDKFVRDIAKHKLKVDE